MKFQHKLTGDNLQEIFGYSKALTDVFLHIKEATGGVNQFIDALPLIEKIASTNAELMQMINEVESDLINQANEILNDKTKN